MAKLELVLNKVLSGRYFVIVCFTVTLCYVAITEPTVRDAFFALAGAAVREYFSIKREEKPKDVANGTN